LLLHGIVFLHQIAMVDLQSLVHGGAQNKPAADRRLRQLENPREIILERTEQILVDGTAVPVWT
jgi:hypothetical protein